MADRFPIRSELWGDVIHQRLDFLHVDRGEEIPFEGAPEKVLRFIQRSSRDLYETPIILEIMASGSFRNVCTYAVGTSHDLFTNRVSGETIPANYNVPDLICEFLG